MFAKNKNIPVKNLPSIGSIIYTKHDGRFDCVTSIIKKIHNNNIEIEFVDNYFSKIIFIDDVLICKASSEDSSYILQCKVINIKVPKSSVVLKIMDYSILPNLRVSKRYDISLISTVLSNNEENYAAIMNVSRQGISIVTRHAMSNNGRCNLKLFLSKTLSILISCSIKWKNTVNNNNIYGLLISEITKKDNDLYNKFIDKLEENENNLAFEFKHLNEAAN